MDEKTMVNDVLNETNSELMKYQGAINECKDIGLRQTLQQIRNTYESFQYELFKIAENKGYYKSATNATAKEIGNVKSEFGQ